MHLEVPIRLRLWASPRKAALAASGRGPGRGAEGQPLGCVRQALLPIHPGVKEWTEFLCTSRLLVYSTWQPTLNAYDNDGDDSQ